MRVDEAADVLSRPEAQDEAMEDEELSCNSSSSSSNTQQTAALPLSHTEPSDSSEQLQSCSSAQQ